MAARSTGGEVTIDFDPKGIRWTLAMPATNVVASLN
jgi:hypothetical protein